MENMMKVFLSYGNYNGEIVNIPIPKVTDDGVLIKVCYCGICGTDQDLFSSECSFAKNGQITYPARLGHEWSGVVEKVGRNVTAFKKGDKVVGDNTVSCGLCEECTKGNFAACPNMMNVGTIDPAYNGAFAEYYMVPQWHLHRIPQYLSLKEATLAEPLSVAYGGIKKMNITEESTVAIIGTGCIAMSAVILSKCLGAKKVFVIGRNPAKLEIAKALGADTINVKECNAVDRIMKLTKHKGADYVIECSGAAGTFVQSLEIAAFRGEVALIGFYENRENDVNIDLIVSKALNLNGVMGEIENMAGTLEILDKYKPDLLPVITNELSFDDCIKGFTRKNYPNEIKTVVRIKGE